MTVTEFVWTVLAQLESVERVTQIPGFVKHLATRVTRKVRLIRFVCSVLWMLVVFYSGVSLSAKLCASGVRVYVDDLGLKHRSVNTVANLGRQPQ